MIEGLVVAIDSSRREGGSVALAEAGSLISERFHDPAEGYAESFFGLLDECLGAVGRQRQEIATIAVVTGPGSFTGLRIGVMTAKTLSFAAKLPLYASSSLELLASRAAPHKEGSVLSLVDAGRDALYAAAYEGFSEHLVPIGDARRLGFDELSPLLKTLPRPLRVAPDGDTLRDHLSEDGAIESHEGTILNPAPLGGTLACNVSQERSWCRRVDPAQLMPVYLGPSQAERAHGLDLGEEVHRPHPPQSDGAA